MSLIVHIYYTGKNSNAKKFAEEMVQKGIVEKIRSEVGMKGMNIIFHWKGKINRFTSQV